MPASRLQRYTEVAIRLADFFLELEEVAKVGLIGSTARGELFPRDVDLVLLTVGEEIPKRVIDYFEEGGGHLYAAPLVLVLDFLSLDIPMRNRAFELAGGVRVHVVFMPVDPSIGFLLRFAAANMSSNFLFLTSLDYREYDPTARTLVRKLASWDYYHWWRAYLSESDPDFPEEENTERCPECGRPISPEDGDPSCFYCGARLLPLSIHVGHHLERCLGPVDAREALALL